jgi:phospholipase C
LANYNFIIPRFSGSKTEGPANSMHAPQDVRPGDQLVAEVYAALRGGPAWSDTLLVVTFDEHGGYFDHVDPPAATNPDGINSPAPGDTASFAPDFAFDRLGLRVPTILASPWLPKAMVCSKPLQHTSVLATARQLLGVAGSLTQRDAAAATFDDLFLAAPRDDTPATLTVTAAATPLTFDAAEAPIDDVTAEMATQWRARTGQLPGAPRSAVKPTNQDEMHQFLRRQVQIYLAYRANLAAAPTGGTKP